MSAHAQFSPSSAHRWMRCPASVALCAQIPATQSSIHADEGTAAHTLAARALDYNKPASFWVGEEIQTRRGSPVFVVDEAMAEAVQLYVDDVRRRAAGGVLLTEQRVEFSEAVGVKDQFGTADAIIIEADCKGLVVEDLKFGMGVKVFAEGNEQMLTYAVAVVETMGPALDELERVTVVVCQPRLDHIEAATYTMADIRAHADALRKAARDALAALAVPPGCDIPRSYFKPGDKACRWCPAKATCPALASHIGAAVYDDFEALEDPAQTGVGPPPRPPAAERLGATFGLLDLIEDWCRAVRSEVERMVLAGMTVIGPDGQPMRLAEGRRGSRAWTDEQVAEGMLTGLLPPEKAYAPRKIISPAQAEKLFKKATASWEPFLAFITQAPGKPKVVFGSDPAAPYKGEAAASEFENLGGET